MTTSPAAAPAIRSYVLRAGRMTSAQRRALEQLWPQYGVEASDKPLALEALFGRRALRTLEIGFGDGEHLAQRAQSEPERDFLGIEVHPPGIGHLLMAISQAGLSNVRVLSTNAVAALERQIPPASLDEIQLLFPDPWPKTRHHKRRMVQPAFADLLASRLAPNGRFHAATDWEPYAEHMLAVLDQCAEFENCAGAGFSDVLEMREPTRFERRGTRLGHQVRELRFRRV